MLCCPRPIFYKTIHISLKSGILIIFFIGSAFWEYVIIIIMSCCCVLSDLIKPFYFLVSVVHLVSLKCFYDSFSNWFCFLPPQYGFCVRQYVLLIFFLWIYQLISLTSEIFFPFSLSIKYSAHVQVYIKMARRSFLLSNHMSNSKCCFCFGTLIKKSEF